MINWNITFEQLLRNPYNICTEGLRNSTDYLQREDLEKLIVA
jgi:hypothetical protein